MKFIPGLKLSERFFTKAVRPLIKKHFPDLSYASARLGWGSDVIGFDTPMSMDHGWGPQLTVFLSENDHEKYGKPLDELFANNLPFTIAGFPTHFDEPLSDGGVMAHKLTYPIRHKVEVTTVARFFEAYLGINIYRPLTSNIWLTIPQQRLRTLHDGRIFHDDTGLLTEQRAKFHWYPHDLWLYLLANQWRRIDQDGPFIGRTGSVGDVIGARLLAARLVREIMRLSFLMERQYAPYAKWFGSAFQQLALAPGLSPIFIQILDARKWQDIEALLSKAYVIIGTTHNALKITPEVDPEVTPFYNRPFLVPKADRYVKTLLNQIQDPAVKELPPHLGNIDQFVDHTDILDDINFIRKLQPLYH